MFTPVFFSFALFLPVILASPTIYFNEEFDEKWRSRWIESVDRGAEAGKFGWSAGRFYGDPEKDKGLQTTEDARFYGISAKFDKPFMNEGKTLVIQYSVKNEQEIDCGGGYIKIFGSDLDQKKMNGDTQYMIMFGPDICGPSVQKVQVIFNYNNVNLPIKKEIACKVDELTHLYTLIVRADKTYEVKIDNLRVEGGELEDDFNFNQPRKIPDPSVKRPSYWDSREMIDDPDDHKPADWDQPERIPDPDISQPEEWDEDMDGEWEPPLIPNPNFKGEWRPHQIRNPAYSGEWVQPQIKNPEYDPDDTIYRYTDIGAVGFDLWQVTSGSIFDNILITDDEFYASQYAEKTWGQTRVREGQMKEKQDRLDRDQREEERKTRKEEERTEQRSERTDDEYENDDDHNTEDEADQNFHVHDEH